MIALVSLMLSMLSILNTLSGDQAISNSSCSFIPLPIPNTNILMHWSLANWATTGAICPLFELPLVKIMATHGMAPSDAYTPFSLVKTVVVIWEMAAVELVRYFTDLLHRLDFICYGIFVNRTIKVKFDTKNTTEDDKSNLHAIFTYWEATNQTSLKILCLFIGIHPYTCRAVQDKEQVNISITTCKKMMQVMILCIWRSAHFRVLF